MIIIIHLICIAAFTYIAAKSPLHEHNITKKCNKTSDRMFKLIQLNEHCNGQDQSMNSFFLQLPARYGQTFSYISEVIKCSQ